MSQEMYLALSFLVGLFSSNLKQLVVGFIILTAIFYSTSAKASNFYTFNYGSTKISVSANNKEEAFAKASKLCYAELTKGKYPGEDAGLAIIDKCVNPKGVTYEQFSSRSSK